MRVALKVTHLFFHTLATAFLLAGLGMNITSLVNPRWQVEKYQEKSEVIYLGLWEDCEIANQGRGLEECKLKSFFPDEEELKTPSGRTAYWRLLVTVLFTISASTGFIGLILAFIAVSVHCSDRAKCIRLLAILWFMACFIATLCSAAGIIIFQRKRDMLVARRSVLFNASFDPGSSFTLAIAATISYASSMLLCLICNVAIFVITQSSHISSRHTWSRHNNIIL